jgi:hypothetical protein
VCVVSNKVISDDQSAFKWISMLSLKRIKVNVRDNLLTRERSQTRFHLYQHLSLSLSLDQKELNARVFVFSPPESEKLRLKLI